MRVNVDGRIAAEELSRQHTTSLQGFVAMWFATDMNEIYEQGFVPAITRAGYDPQRVDRVEHAGRIDDEIIAQIRRSRFVVADFTGHRGGVYFEAGYAMGRELSVFFTCREGDVANLHFDVRQFNTIEWKDTNDLAKRLQVRIEAVIGDGPPKKLA